MTHRHTYKQSTGGIIAKFSIMFHKTIRYFLQWKFVDIENVRLIQLSEGISTKNQVNFVVLPKLNIVTEIIILAPNAEMSII